MKLWKLIAAILMLVGAIVLGSIYGINPSAMGDNSPTAAPSSPAAAAPSPSLGVNLDAINDWNTSLFFTNVALQARALGAPATPWDGAAKLGPDGWPTEDFGACYITDGKLAGTYKLVLSGKCTIAPVASAATVQNVAYDTATNTTTADIVFKDGQLYLAFTNTGGTVKNVRLYAPGYSGQSPMFTKQFADSLKPFSILRTMDFTHTNNNPVSKWADRTTLADATQAGTKGGSWECVIELANQTGKDIWINIPVGADDDYVTNLAKLLKAKLNPTPNVYVEYSNELWNDQFGQTPANRQLAQAEVAAGEKTLNLGGADGNVYYWGYRRVAKRICEISDIFAAVWDKSPRIRPVLASQVASANLLSLQLSYIEKYRGPVRNYLYGVAGAPYYGVSPATQKDPAATVEAIVRDLDTSAAYLKTALANYHAIALSHGVKSLAYEGGVDLGQDDIAVPAKIASQTDPRMKAVTVKYLSGFYAGGGDAFVYFNHCSAPGRFGYWGLTSDVLDLAQPKYQGAVAVATSPTPALEAGSPVPAAVKFASYAFKDLYSQVVNGDVLYINAPERFYFLVRSDADGTYPLTIALASGAAKLDVEVMANGVAAANQVAGSGDWGKFAEVPVGTVTLHKGLNGIAFKTSGCNLRSFTIVAADGPMVGNPAAAVDATLDLVYKPVTGGERIDVKMVSNADDIHVEGVTWKTNIHYKAGDTFTTGTALEGDTFTFTATRKDGGKPAVKTIVIPKAAPVVPAASQPAKRTIILNPDHTWEEK